MDTPDTIRIPLRKRDGEIVAYALIDAVDAALADLTWYRSKGGYAVRNANSRSPHTFLHRAILGWEPGDPRRVDHIDLDKMNCRRSNLREATHAQNAQNAEARRSSSSRHRGVSWCSFTGRWRACAGVGGRQRFLGRFDSEEEAAAVASAFRAEHMPFSVEAVDSGR